MKLLSILFLFLSVQIINVFAAPDYYNFIKSSEGYRNKVYICSNGYYTVGIGHLIGKDKPSKTYYSDNEIKSLFANDLQIAIDDAKYLFPSFNNQPNEIQLILTSLSFNIGRGKLSKFIKFRAAIESRNYKLAAVELKDSKWYGQVGNRGKKYVGILNSIK